MAKVILRKLGLRNYMSFGNVMTYVNLDTNLTTLIMGRNGSGKSVIFQAICWVLFNEGIDKTIKQDGFINYGNEKALEVKLWFDVGSDHYELTRTRKPNGLELIKNGVEQTASTSGNFDDDIVKAFGMDIDIFKNTLLLDANETPFMRMSGPEQRSFMERMLTLLTMSIRAKTLKKMMDQNTMDLRVEERAIEALLASNSHLLGSIQKLKQNSASWAAGRLERLKGIEFEIEQLLGLNIEEGLKSHEEKAALEKELLEIERQFNDCSSRVSSATALLTTRNEKEAGRRGLLQRDADWVRKLAEDTERRTARLVELKAQDYQKLVDAHTQQTEIEKDLKAVGREISSFEQRYNGFNDAVVKHTHNKEELEKGTCPYCKQSFFDRSIVTQETESLRKATGEMAIIESSLAEVLDREKVLQKNLILCKEILKTAPTIGECRSLLNEIQSIEYALSVPAVNPYTAQLEEQQKVLDGLQPEDVLVKAKLEAEVALAAIASSKADLRGKLATFSTLKSREFYQEVDKKIGILEAQYEDLQANSVDPYTAQIASQEAMIQPPDYASLNLFKKKEEHYKALIKLLTDNKSYLRRGLVNLYVPYINKQINSYLTKLGSEHVVEMNGDLSVDITYMGRHATAYGNMSKGERLRLNFATNRAFKNLLLMFGKSYNLTLIDEYFDHGGDKAFFEAAFEIMAREEKSVFIISHREELASMVKKKLLVRKESQFTILEEAA